MLQSFDKQTDKCPLLWLDRMPLSKIKFEMYKLTKEPSIFNEESIGWNLNKQMLLSL